MMMMVLIKMMITIAMGSASVQVGVGLTCRPLINDLNSHHSIIIIAMIQLCLNSTCVLLSHPNMSAVGKKENRKVKFTMQH